MRAEIESAVNFLTKLIAKSNESSLVITPETIDLFSEKLCQLLTEKFQNHWFPEKPIKGQAFRCIRFNENIRREPIVEKACKESGINYDDLKLPLELTLWVDPHEVTCRFGEHKGSYCIVAKHRDGRQEDYIDSINIEELEKKTIERNHNASFDLMNSRKKRANGRKNGYNGTNGYSNGYNGYSELNIQSCSPSSTYYPFYGTGTPFATQYSSSPPNSFKYPLSPTQNRTVGNPSNRGPNNKSYYSNQSINNSKANNQNFSRQLFNNNGNSFQSPFQSPYQPNDRYHWVSKSMAKA